MFTFFYNHHVRNIGRLTEADLERTLFVSSVGTGPRIKKLSVKEKGRLMKSGEEAVYGYFKNQYNFILSTFVKRLDLFN